MEGPESLSGKRNGIGEDTYEDKGDVGSGKEKSKRRKKGTEKNNK